MLWVLDNDVSAAVATMLRRQQGHRAVMVGQIGLARASDDQVSVFADNKDAVLLTHDRELIARRRRNTFGRHVHLDCREWGAPVLLHQHLAAVVELLQSRDAIVIHLGHDGPRPYPSQWI